MKLIRITAAIGAMFFISACGKTTFSGAGNGTLSSKSGALDSAPVNPGLDAADGADAADEEDGDGEGLITQPTVPEFVSMLENDPEAAAEVAEADRCCMSHGQGHGVELCLPGDKMAVSNLTPNKINGDEVCIPASTIKANAALFAGAVMGPCGQ